MPYWHLPLVLPVLLLVTSAQAGAHEADNQPFVTAVPFHCGPATPVTATESDPLTPTFDVAVYDYIGVESEILFAERITTQVFREVGIAVRWVDPCGTVPRIPTAYVNIVPNSMAQSTGLSQQVMGAAIPPAGRAFVFYDRVATTALARHQHPNKLLGFVIAHELGHVMLPSKVHPTGGLMAGILDLQLVRMKALTFTSKQVALMKAYLRVHASKGDALVFAGLP